jgi:hypothetical protein
MCRQLSFHTRYDRLVDESPAPYIHGGVFVRERNVPAGLTDELGLGAPIRLLAMPATRASLRGVARIDQREGYTGEPGFVFNEAPKLPERPLTVSRTLRPSNRGPRADALKVFETDTPIGFGGFGYQPFRDSVVGVALHASLTPGELLQMSLGALRPGSLQLGTDALVTPARLLGLLRRVRFAVGVRSDIDDAKVNAYPVLRRAGRRLLDINRGEKKPLAPAKHQVGFALTGLQHLRGALAADERDVLAPGYGPDGKLLILPTKDTVIVGDGPERFEGAHALLVELVSVRDFGDGANHHLGREPGRALDLVVRQAVHLVLPERAMLPSYLAYLVGRSVGSSKRVIERVSLFTSRKELDLHSQFHTQIMARIFKYIEVVRRRVFLRSLKEAVSNPAFL